MPHYAYERLSAEDASFLLFESAEAHMHLSWVWVFRGGTLRGPRGQVDCERIREHVAARLFHFPRFRQRLAYTPREGHPVWVDDDRFKLAYHVRHVALPDPGDDARFHTTVGAIVSHPLDRSKPLWELWIVEGLGGGRFAIVSKTHHCMIDGVSTVDLMSGLLDAAPRKEPAEPIDWIARPKPTAVDLFRDSLFDRARLALGVAHDFAGKVRAVADPRALAQLGRAVTQVAIGRGPIGPTTPLNRPVGPHRLVNWTSWPLAPLEKTAHRCGGSVDDVMLAIIAGGLERRFSRTATPMPEMLRVVVPISARAADEHGALGNRTDARVLAIPLAGASPRARVASIAAARSRAVERQPGIDGTLWLRMGELGGRATLSLAAQARRRLYTSNLVVTSIPGPKTARYFLDAPLVGAYPLVPLLNDHALGIGIAHFGNRVHMGLVADWELLPDLAALVDDLEHAANELRRSAGGSRRHAKVKSRTAPRRK